MFTQATIELANLPARCTDYLFINESNPKDQLGAASPGNWLFKNDTNCSDCEGLRAEPTTGPRSAPTNTPPP